MKFAFLLPLVLLSRSAASAADQDHSALTLLNSYLEREARTNPEYRADLRRGGDPARLPPGRLFGRGSLLGPFTYRPQTYAELSRPQRALLLRDPQFRAFVATIAQRGQPLAPRRRFIGPEEMLGRRPVLIVIPKP